MKFTFRLLLLLLLVSAGIYATTPWWAPFVLVKLLPPGWQLEVLETGYPGLAGIDVHSLHVKGGIQAADMAIAARDLRFEYEGLKTDADSIEIDIHLRSAEKNVEDHLKLEDLSLPVTKLTGELPQLSVHQLQAVIHFTAEPGAGQSGSPPPLELDFGSIRLVPRTDNSFHLITDVRFEAFPRATGRIEVETGPDSVKADIRFTDDTGSSEWLDIQLEQNDQSANPTTRVRAVFNASSAEGDWLDPLLKRSSGGLLNHVDGRLEVRADFAGQDLQHIQQLSIATRDLQVITNDGEMNLKGEFLASPEGENIVVELPQGVEIHYRDMAGWFDGQLTTAMPGLKRTPHSETRIFTEIAPNGRLVVNTDKRTSFRYNGGVSISLSSSVQTMNLKADKLQVDIDDFPNPESVSVNGLVNLNWEERASFSYTSGDLELEAGYLNAAAELISGNGKLISAGSATLKDARIVPLELSAATLDLTWQELDPLKLTGRLTTQTQGFSARFDDETLTGFDIGINYDLSDDKMIKGAGSLNFDAGHQQPFVFTGNQQSERWEITVPRTAIKTEKLPALLKVAHFELPETIQLFDGYLELRGDVLVDDEITARFTFDGFDMGASMLENTARNVRFSFDTAIDETVSVNGHVSVEFIDFEAGIQMTGFKTGLEIENIESVSLQDLLAQLFDGQLSIENLEFSNNSLKNTTAVLDHINLGRLLEFMDVAGLEGTGFLDIVLPVSNDQGGIAINNGTFRSTRAGRLAYTREGLAGSNIGMRALEDFQYHDLSGTINYQPDGAYLIAVHLEGHNPGLYDGHPIVFNLNISGSLPELFEALFITGDFEEAILNEIRNQ
jgi:hypothetical protein